MTPALRFTGVGFAYTPTRRALDGVDATVAPGECVALVGPNGAGKSTFLALAAGLVEPGEGRVEIAGAPPAPGRAGLVFQDPDDQLFMPSVREDVAFGPRNQGLDETAVRARVEGALEDLGIAALAGRHPHELSGGEKRLAALASILSMEPEVLLLDEPTSDLDARARRRLIERLAGRPEARIVATHDLEMALDLAGRVILLDGGRVAAEGPAARILGDRALLEAHGLEMPWSLRVEHRHGVMPADEHHAEHHRRGWPHRHG